MSAIPYIDGDPLGAPMPARSRYVMPNRFTDPKSLEVRSANAYCLTMDNTSQTTHPLDWHPPMPSEAELIAILAESEAEAEAGLFVSGDDIMCELHESIARMEGRTIAPHHADAEPAAP